MGIGTLVNTAAIILGGLLGLLLKSVLPERVQNTLIKAIGLCVLFIGIGGAMEGMLSYEGGKLVSRGSMMIIFSFVTGTVLGEGIDLERRIGQFGAWLKAKTRNERDKSFMEGFVSTSLIVCVGAMAVVGAIQDGLSGDYSLLMAKSVLDFIIVMIMAASIGKGCIFAAVPVELFQGTITILARFIQPLITAGAMSNLSLTASMLIFCVGVNLIWDKKIKVANMLPAILFALIFRW
jgi:uncharacterized membrane protein YqgA involved in biofilm formation